MKTIWYVARKDLLLVLKDRMSFVFMLLVPLVLIAVFGLALGGLYNSGSQAISIKVAVSNQDKGLVGNTVVKALNINSKQLVVVMTQYADPNQVKQSVADNKGSVTGIVIPAGTTAKLQAAAVRNQPTNNLVQVYTVPTSNDPTSKIASDIVTNVVSQLSTAYFAGGAAIEQVQSICHQPGNQCAQNTINSAAIAESVANASQAEASQTQIEALNAGNVPAQINTFDITLPGYALLFALFGLQSVAGSILQEKEDGTLRRLLIAPVQKYALLGGKLVAQFILTLFQVLTLFVIGYFAFHLSIPSWPAVLALLVATCFATTGLGILLVSIVKTRRQLSPVVTLVTLLTAAIGGAWWPLSLEPQWMQGIAKAGIVAWAMEGLNGVMLSGQTFSQILPDVLGLLVYGVICYLIGLRLFRFQQKTAVA